MMRQNILIRRHALGKFGPFLLEMSRDPAMLLWLDSNSNAKEKPNENFARELMELFTLGVGHYSETDVREAARAFTGWREQGAQAQFQSASTITAPRPCWARPATGTEPTWSGSCLSSRPRPVPRPKALPALHQ